MSRQVESQRKIEKVRRALLRDGIRGILIREQPNFSYITAGGRGFLGLASTRACGMVLITADKAYLIANNIEAYRILREELPEGVFTPYVLPWPQDGGMVERAEELAEGPIRFDDDCGDYFQKNRINLLPEEAARYRALCGDAADALETALRGFEAGITEFAAAGRLSALLWERGIEPISLFVGADDRALSVRHFIPTAKRAEKRLIASICARRYGLVASATRTVCFGGTDEATRRAYDLLLQAEASVFDSLVPGEVMGSLFDKICGAYTSQGMPGEWENHHQGGFTGYLPREIRIDGTTGWKADVGQAFAFNLSNPGAKVEDTLLLTEEGVEVMTTCGNWPTKRVAGRIRPDLLVR